MGALVVILVTILYFTLLFVIGWYAQRSATQGKSVVNRSWIYTLSLAIYCTAWSVYGVIGNASSVGIGFLPSYIGPALISPLFFILLKKMVTISKAENITSIADFSSARYGKSALVGGVVTLLSMLIMFPLIAVQLKAVSMSFGMMADPLHQGTVDTGHGIFADKAFYVTCFLAIITILFGARQIESSDHNEGLIAVVAFESIIKLVAVLAVGVFICFFVFKSPADIFLQIQENPKFSHLIYFDESVFPATDWFWLMVLSIFALILLPRQFHVAVVENIDLKHIEKATWQFPLYLFLISIFVIPLAFAGNLIFDGSGTDADTYILSLPFHFHQNALAILVYLGGLSAATSMVIMGANSLSIMVNNHIWMPFLLRTNLANRISSARLPHLLLFARRAVILIILFIAFLFYHYTASQYSLVSLGMLSFAGIAQLAPAVFIGLYWKEGNVKGALAGILVGIFFWVYCLPFAGFMQSAGDPWHILSRGPFNLFFLSPEHFLGMPFLSPTAHAAFWSLFLNTGTYVFVSLLTKPRAIDIKQANYFVDIYKYGQGIQTQNTGSVKAKVEDIEMLLGRILGFSRAERLLKAYAKRHQVTLDPSAFADAALLNYSETVLSGAIGAASSRSLIASVMKEEPLQIEDVIGILDETREIVTQSKALQAKTDELEALSNELKKANARLLQLDQMKDDFISTVSHELKTPITSIRSFSQILHKNTGIADEKRNEFLQIIMMESDRITRLVNQVLDMSKIETTQSVDLSQTYGVQQLLDEVSSSLLPLFEERKVALEKHYDAELLLVNCQPDMLKQVFINLMSNALKFLDHPQSKVTLVCHREKDRVRIEVQDNGPGIAEVDQARIFEKFIQGKQLNNKPQGTGLGLTISKKIVELHHGIISVESGKGAGAKFIVVLPLSTNEKE